MIIREALELHSRQNTELSGYVGFATGEHTANRVHGAIGCLNRTQSVQF